VVDVLTVEEQIKVILNWQRPLWEGDDQVVKRSGRDEPIWVVIHMYIETTQRIFLSSYLHLKIAKTLCFSFYSKCFFFNKIGEQESRLEGR
jgi:hypothetical protein